LFQKACSKYRVPFRILLFTVLLSLLFAPKTWAQLRAGVAKVDITDRTVGLVNDPLYAKALIVDDGTNKMVIITLDVVAIEEIGPIQNGYLSKVRTQIQN